MVFAAPLAFPQHFTYLMGRIARKEGRGWGLRGSEARAPVCTSPARAPASFARLLRHLRHGLAAKRARAGRAAAG